jgi:type II secretory pathway pseudopilin PulG
MRRLPKPPFMAAFTLVELLVAAAAGTIIMALVATATVGLSRTFNATESHSRAQAAQMRLIDAVALDVRRAVAVSITTSPTSTPGAAGNTSTKFTYDPRNRANPAQCKIDNTRSIQDGTFNHDTLQVGGGSLPSTFLTLKLPNFYQNNTPRSAGFQQAMTLTAVNGRVVRYGTSTGPSQPVIVEYRQAFVPSRGSECYIRREDGVDRIIAERTERIDLDIEAQPEETFIISSWFTPTYRRNNQTSGARVTSSDRVMMRNLRID